MPKQMKACRVCGKRYEACRTARANDGVFRYQEVACSPECGQIYLRRILASRGAQTAQPAAEAEPGKPQEPVRKRRASVHQDPVMDDIPDVTTEILAE